MREKELRRRATCGVCGNKIGTAMSPMFYTVKIERHILDLRAIDRQMGLTKLLGGAAPLAAIMGPDEEMTKLIKTVDLTVCDNCFTEEACLAALEEKLTEDEEEGEED